MTTIDLSALQPISWFAASIGVCVAAFYYVLTLRATLQTRKAQIMISLFDKWDWDKIFQINYWNFNDMDEFMDLFKEENRDKARAFNDVFALYEQTGTMLHEGLIEIRPIARMYGGYYKSQWEKWWPYIKYQREVWKSPRSWIEAEYFYDRLMKFAKEHPEYHILEHEPGSGFKA